MNVLVLAAHPDDEVLGCGGTIARLSSEGHKVTIAILGQGAASRFPKDSTEAISKISALRERSREAGRILGAAEVLHYDLPDNRFDSVDLLDVVKLIEEIGLRVKPDEVFTQHGGDLNVDHQITFRATMTAFRPQPGCLVRSLYSYEVASSTEWAFGRVAPVFLPDTFLDISNFTEVKIQALAVYDGEMREYPNPRSFNAVRTQFAERGARIGMVAAEAFDTIWRRI
jgi:LmbE family N-acetylglucosaminyl deacetylase